MLIQVCIGSSCHIKGSHDIVEMLKSSIEKYNLESDVTLAGSFCTGKCNRVGVTIQIDDEIYTGVTKESFNEFFNEHILKGVQEERGQI